METQIMIENTEEFVCRLDVDILPLVGERIFVQNYNPDTYQSERRQLEVVERTFGLYNGKNIQSLDVTLWCKCIE